MKSLPIACLCATVASLLGQSHMAAVTLSLDSQQAIYRPGDPITISITPQAPTGFSLRAWRILSYVKDLPEDFAAKTGMEVRGNDPQWQSVPLTAWNWQVKPLKHVLQTTAHWPEGDYRVTMHALFRQDAKPSEKTDVYKSNQIMFTLEH